MRRISAAVVSLALALAVFAPVTASAATPSSMDMLKEQLASQIMIGRLIGTSSHSWAISSIYFHTHTWNSTKAVIPVTVTTHAGYKINGTLVMLRISGTWYFYSITRGPESGISSVIIPGGITTALVDRAILEQSSHQYLVTGIVSNGYKKLTVLSRHNNVSTRSVDILLSGGRRHSQTGRVTAYRKTATDGKTYWFLRAMK